jgi:hypothetical protein
MVRADHFEERDGLTHGPAPPVNQDATVIANVNLNER